MTWTDCAASLFWFLLIIVLIDLGRGITRRKKIRKVFDKYREQSTAISDYGYFQDSQGKFGSEETNGNPEIADRWNKWWNNDQELYKELRELSND